MMQLSDLQTWLAGSLFEGAGDIVGLIIFGVILYVVMQATKDTMIMIILLVPVMLILSVMGLISVTITFLMIIAMVIIIALNTSGALFGRD